MTEQEKREILKRERQDLEARLAKEKKQDQDDDPTLVNAVGELITELKASRAEKPKAITRTTMSVKEKSDFISKNGAAAFLKLPLK
jgi:hypothetical protein